MRHYCNRQNTSRRNVQSVNRQIMPPHLINSPTNPDNRNGIVIPENSDISLPPGGDYRALSRIENDSTADEYILSDNEMQINNSLCAQGGAISQRSGYNKQLEENARGNSVECQGCREYVDEINDFTNAPSRMMNEMSGSMDVISLPQMDGYNNSLMPMSSYLQRYKGKYICIDLWTTESRKLEKCGVLAEIGNDFLVIKSVNSNESTIMVDLKTIRYISIYCR